MHIPNSEKISFEMAADLLSTAAGSGWEILYEERKHQLILERDKVWQAKIYLPWTYEWNPSGGIKENPDPHFAIVLIKAGQASVGYFHRGVLLDHKVFRAYMVRQKQGKSQIKHLKTKGKSRAGSRIRLAETERFFEEINERLGSYNRDYPINFWGLSCSKTLWPYYFDSEVAPPFSGDDPHLIELPFHVDQGSFEELHEAGKILNHFHLLKSEQAQLDSLSEERLFGEEEDNW